jgi:hypothetical protein
LRLKSNTFTTLSKFFTMSLPSLVAPFRVCNATTGRNSTIHPHSPFYSPSTPCCTCHAHTLPHKKIKPSALYSPSMHYTHHISVILFAHCFSKLPCQHVPDLRPSHHHIHAQLSFHQDDQHLLSLYIVWFGSLPSYEHLHVFGCSCCPNLPATTPNKLSPRSTWCVFLRYSFN